MSTGGKGGATGSIYFVCAPEVGRVKIGFTAGDPHERLLHLQTASPVELFLVRTIVGTMALERELHAEFAGDRVIGEWFGVEILDHVDNALDAIAHWLDDPDEATS